ncbi:hypothetical protein RclHR1_06290006 [Rhizophagus clarus]|uniref:Uncharacterized protein n=1 Tax=Rhizophagus clarus TaxID=94130 RepID=A0A2Z6RTD0_9GLOM|nr:hypothetical protein RclHR1_06290006 [Rhizophagus clarus]
MEESSQPLYVTSAYHVFVPCRSSQPLYVTSAYHVGLVPCRLSQPPIKSLQPTMSLYLVDRRNHSMSLQPTMSLYLVDCRTLPYLNQSTNTKEAIEIRC